MTRTSEGPDRMRGTPACRQFHDLPSSSFVSTNPNRCCCNPCTTIRPNSHTKMYADWSWCCRCVPRSIFLRFIPDDPDDPCCENSASFPMFFNWTMAESIEQHFGAYVGRLYDVFVTVTLGTIEDGSTVTECAWRVQAWNNNVEVLDVTIPIEGNHSDCIVPPSMTLLTGVTGPAGCTGSLALVSVPKSRLPFVENEESSAFWQGHSAMFVDLRHHTGTGTNRSCGNCAQVCTRICVAGQRHDEDPVLPREYVTFDWFTDEVTGDRGWEYTNPKLHHLERIYLEEDEGGYCYIRPAFEEGTLNEEIYDPVVIDAANGCSCRFHEILAAPYPPDDPHTIEIRCGFCSCWEFACGACRCVPTELCAVIYDGTTWHTDVILTWDADVQAWVGGANTYGSSQLKIALGKDSQNRCVLRPELDGYTPDPNLAFPVWDCGHEVLTREFDPDTDFVNIGFEDFSDPAHPIFLSASSLAFACGRGDCTEATPCYKNCGSHPRRLFATITQWAESGDSSAGAVPPCSVQVELVYWETRDYYTAGIPATGAEVKFSCGYIGILPAMGSCCAAKVELRQGTLTITTPPGYSGCNPLYKTYPLATETCSPYYGDTGLIIDQAIPWSCLGCQDQTFRLQIVITE